MNLFLEIFEKVDLTFVNDYIDLSRFIGLPLTNEQKLFLRNVHLSDKIIFNKSLRQVGISTIAAAYIINQCINKDGFKVVIVNSSHRLHHFYMKINAQIEFNNCCDKIFRNRLNKIIFQNGSEINFQLNNNRYDSADLLFIDEGGNYAHLSEFIDKKTVIVANDFSYSRINQEYFINYSENFWTICEIA